MTDLNWDTETNWNNAQDTNQINISGSSFSLAESFPSSGVAKWAFEQDLKDGWNSHDGYESGNPTYVTSSKEGSYSRRYDGSEYDIFDNVNASSTFSVAFWWYPVAFDQWARLTGLDYNPGTHPGYFFADDGGGAMLFGWQDADGGRTDSDNQTFNTNFSTGNWYHLIGTYGGVDDGTVYVNGSDDTGGSSSNWSSTQGGNTASELQIGSCAWDGRTYNCRIDDYRIYSKELTATEASNLYSTGSISG